MDGKIKKTFKNSHYSWWRSKAFDIFCVHFGELLQEKYPDLRIFKGFCNMNLRIFVYFIEINFRIFNIIRIFALRKYQIVSNFYIKNKEKNI